MANLTKNAIKSSFMALLDERPYNKITVKDIVDGCGVNRNSFYYHFQDIPTLAEEIVRDETDRIIAAYPAIESIEQCLDVTVQFALEHKRAVLHIYNSVNRDIYEQHLWTVCEHVVVTYIDAAFAGRALLPDDRETIVRYYKCLCFGMSIDWVKNGMRDDLLASFHRLCELKRGQAEELIRRCEEQAEAAI